MDKKITVVITHYNDLRIFNCLDSLFNQTRQPDNVLIADGGSFKQLERDIRDYIKERRNYHFSIMRGRCIDTRRKVVDTLVFNDNWIKNIYQTDIIAFIDSDEVAFGDWLENLIEPIEKGDFDFTGGFMLPASYRTRASLFLSQVINKQKVDESYIAMGNSAWDVKIFRKIGNFDDSTISTATDKDNVSGSYHVSDDFDINLRAIKAGFKGKIVEAYALHNQSHIDTYRKVMKYFYGQYVRTAMAYFKHKEPISKFTKASKKVHHPFDLFLILLKSVAFIEGWKMWSKICRN